MVAIRRKSGVPDEAFRAPALSRASLVSGLLFLALLPILAVRPASGAILVDAVSSFSANEATNLAWSHTVGGGEDRVLVVGVSSHSNTAVSGVTYGGTAMDPVVTQVGGGNLTRASLFILRGPPPGPAQVVVTLSGSEDVVGGAVSFTGVDQGTPVGGAASAKGTGATASVAIGSAAGEVVVDAVAARGSAVSVFAGGGQAQQWNIGTGTLGSNIIGGGSTEPGAASVTMSWALTVGRSWAVAAASLRPARVVPDVLIKLASEGAGAFLSDNVYENPAVTQVKSAGVVSGTAAVYDVLIANDGNVPGNIRITGTPGGAGFTVRYRDETPTDQTGEVTGGGHVIAALPPGASRAWTVEVTPSGNPAPVPGGASYAVFVTAVSVAYPTFSDQVGAVTSSISANLTMLKSADKANAAPGEDVTYSIAVSNGTGLSSASTIAVTEPVPANTGFKVGSATFSPGTSTLTAALTYSDGATWTYSPVSGGCGAPPGYDYCVKQVCWTMSGSMPTGTAFGIGLSVQVR